MAERPLDRLLNLKKFNE